MIKKIITAILLVIALNTVGWVKQDNLNHRMFDLNQEKELLMVLLKLAQQAI